jgi:hypothetical protein
MRHASQARARRLAAAVYAWTHGLLRSAVATWRAATAHAHKAQADLVLALRFTTRYRLQQCLLAWLRAARYLAPLRRALEMLQGKVGPAAAHGGVPPQAGGVPAPCTPARVCAA